MDERISFFLSSQTNLTLAVSENNLPYCANCFYAFMKEENILVFKSKPETTHIRIVLSNPVVAGTITPDSLGKMRVQGIQFTGKVMSDEINLSRKAKDVYHKKYPFELAFAGEIYLIVLQSVKFTDNKLGFGKRLEWKSDGRI